MLSGALAIFIVFVVVLFVTMGPVAATRLIRNGTTTIGDHTLYPGRAFPASEQPRPWPVDLGPEPRITSPAVGTDVELGRVVADTDTVALVISVDGKLRYEAYGPDHGPDRVSQIFSVSKSVLSLLIGAAIDDGLIDSVDQPITDYLPELDAGFERVRLEDLLLMTSGSSYAENDNPLGEHVRFNYTDRLEAEILEIESAGEPGTAFEYRSGDNAMLGLALDRALGETTLTDYFWERVWNRIGAEAGGVWSIDREDGLERTWCCLAVSARDLARLGQLILDEGAVDADPVIPADWVRVSTGGRAVTEALLPDWFRESPLSSYGYQWWLPAADRSDVLAIGKDGQYLYVDRTRRAVMVRLGWQQGELLTSQWLDVASQAFDQLAAG